MACRAMRSAQIDAIGIAPAAELRCQAYLSLVQGASGLVWYAWFTTEPWSDDPTGRHPRFLPDSPK